MKKQNRGIREIRNLRNVADNALIVVTGGAEDYADKIQEIRARRNQG